tara:strand:+ start:349 stop:1038 length:690 start_codon:yes stop_codon:yes gene_type:complete
MAGMQDFWEFKDDFFGAGTLLAAPLGGDLWDITDTSAAGTPTYVYVDGSAHGEVALDFDTQAEAQNVCLSNKNVLQFDIDTIQGAEFRVKMNQAAVNATTMLAFGLTGDRNDAIDSIAQNALFRVIGSGSTTAVVVETDDGTNDNDDVATGQTLINAYKTFRIDFSQGTSDVRFMMDDGNGTLKRVGAATTFDMSNYTGSLQVLCQIQKTSDANADGVTLDYVKVWGSR